MDGTVDRTYQKPTIVLHAVLNEDAPGGVKVMQLDPLDERSIEGATFDMSSIT